MISKVKFNIPTEDTVEEKFISFDDLKIGDFFNFDDSLLSDVKKKISEDKYVYLYSSNQKIHDRRDSADIRMSSVRRCNLVIEVTEIKNYE